MAIRKLGKWMLVPMAAVTVGAATIVVAAAAPAGDAPGATAALVQDASCSAPATESAPDTALPSTNASGIGSVTGQVVVKVSITPMVWLEVDDEGRLLSAATNTGCAPRSGDDVVARRPDRSVLQHISIDLDSVGWVGDFTRLATLTPQADHAVVGA